MWRLLPNMALAPLPRQVPLKLQMLYCALSGLTFTVILAFMGVGN